MSERTKAAAEARIEALVAARRRLAMAGGVTRAAELRIEVTRNKLDEVFADLVADLLYEIPASMPSPPFDGRGPRPRIMGIPVHVMDEGRADEDCRLVLWTDSSSRLVPGAEVVVTWHTGLETRIEW